VELGGWEWDGGWIDLRLMTIPGLTNGVGGGDLRKRGIKRRAAEKAVSCIIHDLLITL